MHKFQSASTKVLLIPTAKAIKFLKINKICLKKLGNKTITLLTGIKTYELKSL